MLGVSIIGLAAMLVFKRDSEKGTAAMAAGDFEGGYDGDEWSKTDKKELNTISWRYIWQAN